MSGCCDPSGYKRQFNERKAQRHADEYRTRGLDATARDLVDHLLERGVDGATVLEIGGGVGGVQLELLRAGAAHTTNIEMSPDYGAMAEKLAQAAGLHGRMDSLIGDLVELAPQIEPADIVVMHRVVCCYPYLDRLLAPAANRARRSLALTFPRRNALTRAVLRLWNTWLWSTRCSFRLYAHAPAEIERIAREHGLSPAFRRRRFVWESVVYERTGAFSG